MKVKICGVTRMEDALAAAMEGVDAIGFIFVPSSPRYIDPKGAAEIVRALPPFVVPVGVFVNADRREILQTIATAGIRCLQLHGDETPEETEDYAIPVLKSFRVGDGFDVGTMGDYHVAAYLLDTYEPEKHGGTCRSFDWQIAIRAKQYGRVILSGGLTPDNVDEAARCVRPYAIDLSSGVESSPGIKDREKIRALFAKIGSDRN